MYSCTNQEKTHLHT